MEKYFKFDGVSTRSEYWAVMIIATVLGIFGGFVGGFVVGFAGEAIFASLVGLLWLLAVIVAVAWAIIATTARRCRDAGINVWWTLGACVPYVGWIVSIVIGVLPTEVNAE
jgi:uncharacterized membrane protein YhaH (DUF805 family)